MINQHLVKTIVAGLSTFSNCGTADLSHNAKQRLDRYPYNAVLFDFFMQDNVRVHLQQMGTSSEDALERYRRFSIVLDAVISKFDSP